ncbi:alpha/beta hydrolase [Chloroflexota bacterium]
MRRDIEFKSQGVTCRGWLYTPDSGKGPFPAVVQAFGGGYVREFPVIVRHADAFTKAGIAVVSFDYRYFGSSDGEPRQLLDPWAQIEDCQNALTFAETQPDIDKDRLGIWGISIGGGTAPVIAAVDRRVKCCVGVVPMLDGYRNQRRVHGEHEFQDVLKLLLEDRRKRFHGEDKRMQLPQSPEKLPCEELVAWPEPEVYEVFVPYKNSMAPKHEHWWQVESLERIINFTAFPYLPKLTNMPILMIVANGDMSCPWDIAIEAFNQIPSAQKKIFILPKEFTHMSIYANADHTKVASAAAAEFLSEYLIKRSE